MRTARRGDAAIATAYGAGALPSVAPQITVLDAGGQYCHLIARKIRDLGVSADVRPSETPASELAAARA